EWVVDLRQRRAFARHHAPGTISVEMGDSFATFLGWAMPWGRPLSLIGESATQVAAAQRELARIGVEQLTGAAIASTGSAPTGSTGSAATGSTDGTARSASQGLGARSASAYRVAGFEDLAPVLGQPGVVVVDVRRRDEWDAGHVSGAVHIPFWEIEDRVEEIPPGEVWAYCATGLRASISASLIERSGRRPVLIDDDWPPAAGTGLPIVR
ncbi:MAG: rhodanese-like domain-containing protein, partial [Acidimicrobiales bacterium]